MLEIGIWAGGEGAGEPPKHVNYTFLGSTARENISNHLYNQRACDVTCRAIAGVWQIVLCGCVQGTAVSATALNALMLHILGCAWLRATGLN